MRTLWEEAELSSLEARMSLLASFAVDLRTLGPANFLYADGDALFAHGHRRRQRAGGRAEPPGLWVLQRHCAPTDPSPDHRAGVSIDHAEQVALLVASVPLTDEAWRPLSEGELVAVRAGDVLATRFPAAA
jgi:glutamine amidotransferase